MKEITIIDYIDILKPKEEMDEGMKKTLDSLKDISKDFNINMNMFRDESISAPIVTFDLPIKFMYYQNSTPLIDELSLEIGNISIVNELKNYIQSSDFFKIHLGVINQKHFLVLAQNEKAKNNEHEIKNVIYKHEYKTSRTHYKKYFVETTSNFFACILIDIKETKEVKETIINNVTQFYLFKDKDMCLNKFKYEISKKERFFKLHLEQSLNKNEIKEIKQKI